MTTCDCQAGGGCAVSTVCDVTALHCLVGAMQGKGASADRAKLPRDTADRIYGYDIYNDLGGDILKNPGNKRTPLGSKDYPYPR